MFHSTRDAEMRINQSIIQGPDGPIYVTDVTSPSEFIYRPITERGISDESLKGDITDKAFNIQAFRIGYVNNGGESTYLQRLPTRKWKQGLCKSNLTFGGQARVRDAWALMHCPGFFSMYHNTYPSFKKALEGLTEYGLQQVAFARQWCINGKKLMYKGQQVGIIKGGEAKLSSEYTHLKESLEEALNV